MTEPLPARDAAQPSTAQAKSPWRMWQAWLSLALGVIFVGVGIGMMVEAGWGVSPLDAFFSGAAKQSGLTMGVILATLSILMVLVAWVFGIRPAIGTLVSALGIGVFVDIARMAAQPLMDSQPGVAVLIALWLAGLAIFCAGVLALFASELGASPYDQLTRALSKVLHVSLGLARIILDGAALLLAFLLGGSWGIGTLLLLLVVPVVLNRALPFARKIVHGPALVA